MLIQLVIRCVPNVARTFVCISAHLIYLGNSKCWLIYSECDNGFIFSDDKRVSSFQLQHFQRNFYQTRSENEIRKFSWLETREVNKQKSYQFKFKKCSFVWNELWLRCNRDDSRRVCFLYTVYGFCIIYVVSEL